MKSASFNFSDFYLGLNFTLLNLNLQFNQSGRNFNTSTTNKDNVKFL